MLMFSKTTSPLETTLVVLLQFNSWLWLPRVLSLDEGIRRLTQIPTFHTNSQGIDFIILLGIYIPEILIYYFYLPVWFFGPLPLFSWSSLYFSPF
jgi:hypothetical protein